MASVGSNEAITDAISRTSQLSIRRKQLSYRRAISNCSNSQSCNGSNHTEIKSTVDWTEAARPADHVWFDTQESGDFCCLIECTKHEVRKKCAACRIVIHDSCLVEIKIPCKASFREASPRSYRSNLCTQHHWVHRVHQKGKCAECGKAFTQRFAFQTKEYIAISCSWCKLAYHSKKPCFSMGLIGAACSLGPHVNVIVPPSWIIKLSQMGSFRSTSVTRRRLRSPSIRRHDSTVSSTSFRRRDLNGSFASASGLKRDDSFVSPVLTESQPFVIKSIPSPEAAPLIVFINPRSGGNQGARIMHKLRWLLNPRQVFDLAETGPLPGLDANILLSKW